MAYKIVKYELRLDQAQYPNLNPAQFGRMCDIEAAKLIQTLYGLDCEFVALQDLTNLNVATKFFKINEYHAVRQITHYDPQTKTVLVIFDASALLNNAEEQPKIPGEDPIVIEGEVTPGVTAATESVH